LVLPIPIHFAQVQRRNAVPLSSPSTRSPDSLRLVAKQSRRPPRPSRLTVCELRSSFRTQTIPHSEPHRLHQRLALRRASPYRSCAPSRRQEEAYDSGNQCHSPEDDRRGLPAIITRAALVVTGRAQPTGLTRSRHSHRRCLEGPDKPKRVIRPKLPPTGGRQPSWSQPRPQARPLLMQLTFSSLKHR